MWAIRFLESFAQTAGVEEKLRVKTRPNTEVEVIVAASERRARRFETVVALGGADGSAGVEDLAMAWRWLW